jgi:oxygen-independent coproporphyrinogen-3 oxidase
LKKAGLYIHFPFCRRTCFYCHFFKKAHDRDQADRYMQRLLRELELRQDRELVVDTVYFGGGSPSLLSGGQLRRLLRAVQKNFILAPECEISLEANPDDVSPQSLDTFRRLGINRLSLGVQSFQEPDLRALARTHSALQAAQAVAMARAAGFADISIDMIIGLEAQTSASLSANGRMIAALNPTHVSVYILEGVPRPPSDEFAARLYFETREDLLAMGYRHYEVSNYCLPGHASRHNLKYWQDGPYIGLGASACGYGHGRDYKNVSDLKKYGAALDNGRLPQTRIQRIAPDKRRIITGLRLLDGLPASCFMAHHAAVDFLLAEGLLIRRGENLAVPPERILLLNEILGYFI